MTTNSASTLAPKNSRLRTVVFAGVGLALVASGIAKIADGWNELAAGPALAKCDDDGVTAAVKNIAKQSHVVLTDVTDIRSLSRNAKEARCSAEITASDHTKGRLMYWIGFDGKNNAVHVTGVAAK
ncbi:MAG: hypothetical protein KGO02_01225 [Alphaproteobacteria bacterium]|nr:hypothetical protein [Alphaproteobacteria bacterium]